MQIRLDNFFKRKVEVSMCSLSHAMVLILLITNLSALIHLKIG